MKPVRPSVSKDNPNSPFRMVTFAENQPEYLQLPALRNTAGLVVTEWQLDEAELDLLIEGGHLRISIETQNQPLQPLRPEVVIPGE